MSQGDLIEAAHAPSAESGPAELPRTYTQRLSVCPRAPVLCLDVFCALVSKDVSEGISKAKEKLILGLGTFKIFSFHIN